jgi:hypothetical protein
MSTGQPARIAGEQCPPWCTCAHETRAFTTHIGEQRDIRFGGEMYHAGYACLAVAATWTSTRYMSPEPGRVLLHGHVYEGPDALAMVPAAEAPELAAVVEMLAGATPEQHRELAAAIREAAGEITGPAAGAGS